MSVHDNIMMQVQRKLCAWLLSSLCESARVHTGKQISSTIGTLWYIKSSPKPVPDLSPATPSDPFPDNSTGNQFFDRALFESYARLGHIYAKAVCTDILADGNWARRAQREVRAFDLRDAPPHPVGGFPHVNPIVIVHDANREVPSPL